MTNAVYPSLAGRTVVVTGGGSGIGEVIVAEFVRQKSRVFFLDVAVAESQALAAKLGGGAKFVPCDVTDTAALRKALADVEAAAGPVSVLVNNAANDDRHDFEKVTPEYWQQRIDVNLKHLFFAAQAVTAGMRKAGGGSIINLGSVSWHTSIPSLSIYETAKAGIEGMTRALARDLGESNIRVNCVVPGAIRTPRQIKLWHTPEEETKILAQQCLKQRVDPIHVAAMVLFLASDDARMCTSNNYWVDAGYR
jgi:NAD(P)-dependent dehydrogenase (short-subunit alcohol dehydrogenase family)